MRREFSNSITPYFKELSFNNEIKLMQTIFIYLKNIIISWMQILL